MIRTDNMNDERAASQSESGRPAAGRLSFGQAMRQLRGAQKSSKGAPAYSRFVNRRAGRFLAAAAYRLGMTPNMVTAVSALFSFAAIALLALAEPSWLVGIAVALGLMIGYALDSADGQLARLRGGGSLSGEWLDHMIDATKISSLHLAVLVAAYRFFELGADGWLLIPIGFTIVAAVSFFGMILNDQLKLTHSLKSGVSGPAPAGTSALRSLLVIPTDYGVLCLIFLLLGAPTIFFAGYTLLFLGSAGYLALACIKWFRVMADLDRRTVAAKNAGSSR